MSKISLDFPICILGAGPTGLYLAIRFTQLGIPFFLLEKKSEASKHSRSIGIHPPSLNLFKKNGFLDAFLEAGNRVMGGQVYSNKNFLGSLSFQECPAPFQYVLTLPQFQTETILEAELVKIGGNTHFYRNVSGIQILKDDSLPLISWNQDETHFEQQFSYVIDACGKNSPFREYLGFSFNEEKYPDSYVMADFERTTQAENQALIFADAEGIIESFPLPGNIQRWVLKTDSYGEIDSIQEFSKRIQERTSHSIDENTCTMFNSFGVQKASATSFVNGRFILCGDSAHVVSPIGGQGMNLAWLNAETLVDYFIEKKLTDYEMIAKQRWQTAVKRSEFNMFTGRRSSFGVHQLKNLGIKLVLSPLFSRFFANQFTMQGF